MSDNEEHLSVSETNLRREDRQVAYAYTRVSSPQQDLNGDLEGQIVRLADNARTRHWVSNRYYADRAVSLWQSKTQIPDQQVALEQLQKDILNEENCRKFIYGVDVSRFARNRHKGDEFFLWAMKHGIAIRTLTAEYFPDEISRSAWRDDCILAEEFVQQLSINSTNVQARTQISGRKKWGFQNQDGERTIVPNKGSVVREIYDLVADGASLAELTSHLEKSGQYNHRSPSPKRYRDKVLDILHEPWFAGAIEHRDTAGQRLLEPATWVGVVSIDEFIKMQFWFPRRVLLQRGEFYLDGRVKCSACRNSLKPAKTNYSWRFYEKQRYVLSNYVCRGDGCRPLSVYDARKLHYAAKRLLETWEQVSGDTGYYQRWANSGVLEQKAILKEAFGGKHFYADQKRLIVRFRGETYDFPL
jgi:DNA invertase Pin-like site-specific DNA recombinase